MNAPPICLRNHGLMRGFRPLTWRVPHCAFRSVVMRCRHRSRLRLAAPDGSIRIQRDTPQAQVNWLHLQPLQTRRAPVPHAAALGLPCTRNWDERVQCMQLKFKRWTRSTLLTESAHAPRNCAPIEHGPRCCIPRKHWQIWRNHSVGNADDDAANGSGRNNRVSRLHTLSVNS